MTLADAIFLALRENRTVKSAYIDRIAEKFDLRVAEDRFAPQFEISGGVARQRIGDVRSTVVDVSPGVSLQTTTGATFEFAWVNEATANNGDYVGSSAGEVSVEQPLLRGAGRAVNMAPLQSARFGEEINRLRLKAIISETIGNVIFAHRDLFLAQERLKLAEAAKRRSEELLRVNRALIGAGRMPEQEALQTEADLENQKLRLLQATRQVEVARLALADLLVLDLGTEFTAVESLNPKKFSPDLGMLLLTAFRERQDYQGQLYVIEQNRLGLVVAENEQLWDISLFARGRFGVGFEDGAQNENIDDVTAGIQFKIPIGNIRQRQPLVRANVDYQNAEVQLSQIRTGIETQIRTSVSEIEILWRQISVAEKSYDLALRVVEVEKLKLNAGRSTTFEVQAQETALRTAESQLLTARIGYINALTRLDLQLGTTLETWKIALRSR